PEARECERSPCDDEDPADRVPRTLAHDHDAEDRHADVHEHVEDVCGAPDPDVARKIAPAIDEHEHEGGDEQHDGGDPEGPGQPPSGPRGHDLTPPRIVTSRRSIRKVDRGGWRAPGR